MRQQDNLEQLYRERYKDLETIPKKDLWANIAARLPEKETRKRVIPLWYGLAGAAAAVVSLLAIIGISNLNSNGSPVTNVVYKDNSRENNFIDITSKDFEQDMQNSAEMLKNLRESTIVLQSIQQIIYPAEKSQQTQNSVAQNIQQTAEPFSDRNPYYEKQIAEVSKENMKVPEKLDIPVPTETEVAEVESGLKDLNLEAGKEMFKDTEAKTSRERKFQLKTTAAAVYFDNLGKGNAIDNQLAGNDGGGDISFAYGIAVAYKLSDKLSIRSGINKVDLSYNTRNVSYGTAVSAMALEDNEARAVSLASPVMGNINQSLGFVEVPVELKYGIVNRKIGLNVIGGASTLFLNDNSITLEAGNATTSFGEAANLNDVSFSTNIGLGVDYNISPQFQINVEPIFKYQINTFNNTSDVKPYYFGIYSGLSFRF